LNLISMDGQKICWQGVWA